MLLSSRASKEMQTVNLLIVRTIYFALLLHKETGSLGSTDAKISKIWTDYILFF